MTTTDTPDITRPLRLAVGSHQRGSGKGCAMNLISWENGDKQITDMPDCADPMLARIVQRINDGICDHRDGDLLCPACSIEVLDLAHRTVGTGTLPLTDHERRVVWVKIAVDQARQVLHLVPKCYKQDALDAIRDAEHWISDPSFLVPFRSYAYAADAAANAAAANANAAAAYAAAAANAAAAYAADAADAGGQTGARLSLARRAFDLFDELTRHVRVTVTDRQVADAYACMVSAR